MLAPVLVLLATAAAGGVGDSDSSGGVPSCEPRAVSICGAARNTSMRACGDCLTNHSVELIRAGCTNTMLIDWCHRTCASPSANHARSQG